MNEGEQVRGLTKKTGKIGEMGTNLVWARSEGISHRTKEKNRQVREEKKLYKAITFLFLFHILIYRFGNFLELVPNNRSKNCPKHQPLPVLIFP